MEFQEKHKDKTDEYYHCLLSLSNLDRNIKNKSHPLRASNLINSNNIHYKSEVMLLFSLRYLQKFCIIWIISMNSKPNLIE